MLIEIQEVFVGAWGQGMVILEQGAGQIVIGYHGDSIELHIAVKFFQVSVFQCL